MGIYKTCAFLAVFIALTNGDYHYENYKVYNFDGESEPYRKPWFFDEYSSPLTHKSSGGKVQGYNPGLAANSGPEVYENPAEIYYVASTKRVPNEDKNFKKAVSPFFTLTDSDNEKYKSIILKSGAPYCQEIKSVVPKKRYRRDAMTCYKCKDPKNGATYEQCSYTSEPQETSQINEYVPLPPTLRYRRSNAKANEPKVVKLIPEVKAEYRFGEEYFTPAASEEVPAEYKKKMENCDKVVKDSMICMVCKDPETNGKYEQCSYTNQPNDKAYAYSKSSSFGLPHDEKAPQESRAPAKQVKKVRSREEVEEIPASYTSPEVASDFEGSHPEVDKYFEEQTAAIKARTPRYKTVEEPAESARLESGSENVKDGSCKKIVKDTMVCTVCKDPKTGGNYEQCAYAYNPSDKVYQFSRQKTFGYPDESGRDSAPKTEAYTGEGEEKEDYQKPSSAGYESDEEPAKYNYDQPSEKQESHEYVPYTFSDKGTSYEDIKSESEKITEANKDAHCEKVKKDSMTCMVCKDPKTGGNSEQCSYAYEPNDKLFSYSKAKSYGSPEEGEKASYAEGGESPATEYSDKGSYGLASDNKPYVAGGDENSGSEEERAGVKDAGELAIDFFSTAEKKKEIEKVLSEFQQEDRSKCKKVLRDKLTCFQCTGKDGVQNEECIFVAAQEPAKDRLAYREVKEYRRDPAAAEDTRISENYRTSAGPFVEEAGKPVVSKKQKRKAKKSIPAYSYAEPLISASENDEQIRDAEENSEVRRADEEADSDPYDYASVTKPTYDKVLGITLPRYMLTTSEHEIEFDEVVASTKP